MRLCILGKEKLHTFHLLEKNEKNFFINYHYSNEITLQINIEKEEEKWILKSNELFTIEWNKEIYEEYEINHYDIVFLNMKNTEKIMLIFMPDCDKKVYNLSYTNLKEILIGSNQKCNICYSNPFIEEMHAKIKLDDEKSIIMVENESAKMYINGTSKRSAELKTGDIIFINGLKIIWNRNFIKINNPKEKVSIKGFSLYKFSNDNTMDTEDNNEVVELYNENDYFVQKLLLKNKVVTEKILIDPPPSSEMKEKVPFWITLGSSITLLGASFSMIFNIINNILSGTMNKILLIPQIVVCITMLVGSLLMPRLIANYNKKNSEKREKIRLEKYTKYLNEKNEEIQKIVHEQERTLLDNNPNIVECSEFLSSGNIQNVKFWSRSVSDEDFANVRLGVGNILSKIEIDAPEKHFTLIEDTLLNKVYDIKEQAEYLHNVPITINLAEKNKIGFMLKNTFGKEYIEGLLLQLYSLHRPSELKIIIFTSEEKKEQWEYTKYLPHCWSDDKSIRFFACNSDEIQNISDYLSIEYKNRKEKSDSKKENSTEINAEQKQYQREEEYKNISPYYIVIDDNYKESKNSTITKLLIETDINFGFSYVGIGKQLRDFSGDCQVFIEINEKNGNIIEKNTNSKEIVSFQPEYAQSIDIRKVVNSIANVPILSSEQSASLPQTLTFLEMFDISKIEQFNILNRWKNNNPVQSLSTVIGVHTNGEKFKLDLHEKAHGPHGLIAGMTGSGKSEFIITYILSMLVNYHPYEVQFVLIDYKGGGLSGAFENKELGYKVPHLVGTITNLDKSSLNRTLVSIESECKRRQILFNEVRDKLGESTIDIYKYQKLYREGAIKEPLAHLFIISDEFAELKAQQPDFMDQLISVARIGRSLGIHLILATQKPSGVVNDQIWSNSKFKVCLKVQDRSDSTEMLKKPDAASLKETGRFFLQVGYDDYFDIGQSGWSGAKYVPSNTIIKKVDESVNFVNNVGYPYKTIKSITKVNNEVDYGDQLTNIVKKVCEISTANRIETKQLWLDPIPDVIYINDLKQKYSYEPEKYYINPVIGEYDNPSEQQQGLLNVDLTNNGNTLIYGQTGSGKEQLLSTMISSICFEHNPEEVNIYIADFGSGSLKIFKNMPHVGGVVTVEEQESLIDLFKMLYDIIDERKKIFESYGGNYIDYCNNSGKKLPLIVVVINNYEIFTENNSRLSDEIVNLYRDGTKYGISFVISVVTSNGIRLRTAQFFENKISLQLPDASHYRDVVNAPRGLVPANIYGRGLIEKNDTAYEFQTALMKPKEETIQYLREVINQFNNAYSIKAKPIPTIPNVVEENLFKDIEVKETQIPIGYNYETKQICNANIENTNFFPIVTEEMNEKRMSFVYAFINMLKKITDTKIKVIDFVDVYENKNNVEFIHDDFNHSIVSFHNEIVKNNGNSIYIILGIGQAAKIFDDKLLMVFNKALETVSKKDKCKVILIDTYISYKNIFTQAWYQSILNNHGIWLGENVGVQQAINITDLSLEDRKIAFDNFAFYIENGHKTVIRHMIESDDNYEQ